MEERYEIRGKIGQGGLGAVYRGYDTRMHREVAIKRISVSTGDRELQEESTRQLMKEAGTLASLQHPNIVTIYDVGADEDGPYVVMELISGKTLDELIERAPLTWNDFRELALQTVEALIAAHELNLIHSDIKPSNLMLTWLPSGKFQMKIVDFGLATLTQSQSHQELLELEAVFGSIYFMAPEQFERVPSDSRTDLYSLGCVFYQALTGIYPFQGESASDVMVAHLHHNVIPLQQVRADIPLWVCDWIMWHMNRQASDRPESARQALQVFLQNDAIPNPPMSSGRPAQAVPTGPKRRIVAPVGSAGVATSLKQETHPSQTAIMPQPLLPPEGSKPSVYNERMPAESAMKPSAPLPRSHNARPISSRTFKPHSRKKSKAISKIAWAAIITLLSVTVVTWAIMKRMKANESERRFATILEEAAKPGSTEIPMTGPEFNLVLKALTDAVTEERIQQLCQALARASSSDGSDFTSPLTDFATKSMEILPEVREQLIRDVLSKHASPAMVPPLTDFARTTNDTRSAIAAIQAVRTTAGDKQFEDFLTVSQFHPNDKIRQAAEETTTDILRRSNKPDELQNRLASAIKGTSNAKALESLHRIQSGAKR